MDEEKLKELEKYIDENRWHIQNIKFDCTHSKSYELPNKFKLRPGHRLLILQWCNDLKPNEERNDLGDLMSRICNMVMNHPSFPPLRKS